MVPSHAPPSLVRVLLISYLVQSVAAQVIANCSAYGAVTPCYLSQLSNRQCDRECNTVACGYDECTTKEVEAECIRHVPAATAEPPAAASKRVSGLTAVAMRVDFSPLTFFLDPVTFDSFVKTKLEIELEWEDDRLFDPVSNPCSGSTQGGKQPVICSMLTLTEAETAVSSTVAQKDEIRSAFWLPKVGVRKDRASLQAYISSLSVRTKRGSE